MSQLLLIVLLLAGAGALSGLLWEWVWTPPAGVVVEHRWVAENGEQLRTEFSGTGWYVVVGTLVGLLLGAVVTFFLDRKPLITLLGVVLGSGLGAWLMLLVGTARGPQDPAQLALTASDGTSLPQQLGVSGATPYLALPAAALLALCIVFLGFHKDRARPRTVRSRE